jgi:lipopolysaccharide export system permease protein
MPAMRLLFRALLTDLLRVIGLTAGVLVTVIAFGATIKPLASDALLDAWQTVKYLMLAIVPMLQFALPFAAGFGATLCLHRMTADNEVQAMAVSGQSYRRILNPVLALGVALTVLMVGLTQWIIPQFWSLILQTASSDITKVFQASITRGEPFELGDLQIYADDIVVKELPEGEGGPQTRMVLLKVAAARLDDDRRVVTDVTAGQAVVDVYRRLGRTYLKMVMSDTVAFDSTNGRLVDLKEWRPPRAFVLPSAFRDHTKTMTRGQLLHLRENPDDFAQVIDARESLVESLRHVEVRQFIDDSLANNGRIEAVSTGPDASAPAKSYVINANRRRDGRLIVAGDRPVEIVQFEGDTPGLRFQAAWAELVQSNLNDRGLPTFDLILQQYEVTNLRSGDAPNSREELTIPALTIAGAPEDSYAQWTSARIIDHAPLLKRSDTQDKSSKIDDKIAKLQDEIADLQREITSRLTARYALSITALLLLLLGSLLAMWLRGSLPLTVYTWAFLPSVLDLILISAGEQLMRDGRMLGLPILWSGNVIMVISIVVVYMKLARN